MNIYSSGHWSVWTTSNFSARAPCKKTGTKSEQGLSGYDTKTIYCDLFLQMAMMQIDLNLKKWIILIFKLWNCIL